MKTNVTELESSRVRVEVEVDPPVVERRLATAARAIGRDLKMPGFRKGKVPAELVLQRVGRATVMEEAFKEALPHWYEEAVLESGVATVGDPDISLEKLPEEGEPLAFAFEIGVRPKATLGEYRGVEVGRREAEVPEQAVQGELDRLREAFASLEPVERAAAEGDFAVVDFEGAENGEAVDGLEGRDQLVELGSGRFPKGFEESLVGASEGDDRKATVEFPEDYGSDMAGRTVEFSISVKAVNEKRLPGLDDDFAAEASEFDTLEELRAQIAERVKEALEGEISGEFRQAVVDAVADDATVSVPEDLVVARAEETWNQVAHRLSHQGIDAERYLEITGKSREEMIEEAKPEADRSLRREAVLAAVVEAEGLEVDKEEMLEALEPAAREEKVSAKKLLERLKSSKRDSVLRQDLLMRKAVELLADAAKPVAVAPESPEGEAAEKDAGEKEPGEKLWVPGRPAEPES